jgi:hypothetical protein
LASQLTVPIQIEGSSDVGTGLRHFNSWLEHAAWSIVKTPIVVHCDHAMNADVDDLVVIRSRGRCNVGCVCAASEGQDEC